MVFSNNLNADERNSIKHNELRIEAKFLRAVNLVKLWPPRILKNLIEKLDIRRHSGKWLRRVFSN